MAVGVESSVEVVSIVGIAVLLMSVGVEVNVRVGVTGVGVGRGVAVSVCVGAGVAVGCGANVPNEQAREKIRRSVSKNIFLMVYFLGVGDGGFGVAIGQPVSGVRHGHGYISNALS